MLVDKESYSLNQYKRKYILFFYIMSYLSLLTIEAE